MAIITYKTFLMHKSTGDYTKLIDIIDMPDIGGAPEMLDITTLSDAMRLSTPGIQSNEGMNFTALYDKTDYAALKALEGKEEDYAVWMGGTESGGEVTPDGSDGKFSFKGRLSVFVASGGVNDVHRMTITIAPSTAISAS